MYISEEGVLKKKVISQSHSDEELRLLSGRDPWFWSRIRNSQPSKTTVSGNSRTPASPERGIPDTAEAKRKAFHRPEDEL